MDGIVTASTAEALDMAARLAREEGLLCGPSSGINVVAALKVADSHPEFRRIVTVIADTGQRYLSGELFGERPDVEEPERDHEIDAETLRRSQLTGNVWSSCDERRDDVVPVVGRGSRDPGSRARRFIDDELIPWEVHAEEHEGLIPEDARERHHRLAIELGLFAMNMPKELGGTGMTMLQQTLVSEQLGRVTNALGWCVHTPPAWAPAVVTPEQLERWIVPTIRGERHECYAITEEGAGSDVDAIAATARRDGDEYVLNGTKMHVTSFNSANYCFFQGKIVDGDHAGEHAMFFVDQDTPGVRVVRVPRYSHTYADQHPIVAFEDVRVPASNLVGRERATGSRSRTSGSGTSG